MKKSGGKNMGLEFKILVCFLIIFFFLLGLCFGYMIAQIKEGNKKMQKKMKKLKKKGVITDLLFM